MSLESSDDAVTIRGARPTDRDGARTVLADAGLPTAELERWFSHFVVAEADGEIVGLGGLELHGQDGILRSVVVDDSWRGRGVGARLVSTVISNAREQGVSRLYLLTTSAADYFSRHGFERISREDAPRKIRGSVEFRDVCPDSAVAMTLNLVDRGTR